MRYLFVLLIFVSQKIASQTLEVLDGEEYFATILLIDAKKAGVGLGATEKKNNYPGRLEMEIVNTEDPQGFKVIRVDVYRLLESRGGRITRVLARNFSQSRPLEIGEIEVWGVKLKGGVAKATYKVILPAREVDRPTRVTPTRGPTSPSRGNGGRSRSNR
ncbi:hypothetical protein L0P88_08475 [Muricauda sp. SCSIO 64092]|uniref:hypothetical protein n=1 Tax=Allomuricauda sp. SCSIO 64092 TaxID=2908842 RepID=UPI001FF3BED0|nr:hypothetical protein [Muricauda sp. SCSIO 64092]UOY08575.1 hypothetical protein L0P88_08475 [Muricauda sp. SCSIO 64092]